MDDSRPRGILSPADRTFLAGEAEFTNEQSAYDARYRIRERLRHALLDFEFLFDHLSDHDRRKVFSPPEDRHEAFTRGLVSAVAFLYLGTAEYDPPRENIFAEGIRRAAERETGDKSAFCSVRINVEQPTLDDLERILACVERGAYHELDERDLRALACFMHRHDRSESDVVRRLRAALGDEQEEG